MSVGTTLLDVLLFRRKIVVTVKLTWHVYKGLRATDQLTEELYKTSHRSLGSMPLFRWRHFLSTTTDNDLIKQHGKARSRGTDHARKAGSGNLITNYPKM